MTKRLELMIVLSLGLIFLCVGYFGYILLWPVRTLEVKSATPITKELHLGEVFYYVVDYCKYTTAPAVVYRTFHSVNTTPKEHIETFPSVATITTKGCAKAQIPLQTYADSSAPPGEYYMLVDAQFTINPLRQEHVLFKSSNFIIK